MDKSVKSDCQRLKFSPELSQGRMEKAQLIIGTKTLRNILCLCLYLLGVKRNEIAEYLGIPSNTVRSKLKAMMRDGISAIFDRRKKRNDTTISSPKKKDKKVHITQTSEMNIISIGNTDISIHQRNKLQFKVFVLMLAENKLITKIAAGALLGVSSSHIGYLCKKLKEEDLPCLIDKRKGQREDYVFTPEIKSELILQFATNASCHAKTSGHAISSDLQKRSQINLSERSVRYHLSKLGLSGKADKMRSMICTQKKNFRS